MILVLLEQQALLQRLLDLFTEFSYLAPFLVLLLCGLGLPLPEEVTLIGAGILLYRGEVEFLPITGVCIAAILLGDSVPFLLGKYYGMSALRIRWVARLLHPERFAKIKRRFDDHGSWAVFAFRFFAGVRLPGYFVAGTMGMKYTRFLLLDFLGALVSVPASIYLGEFFGGQIEKLKSTVHDLHLILAFILLVVVGFIILRARNRRLEPSRQPPEQGGPPSAPPSDPR